VSHTLTLSFTITALIGAIVAGIEPDQSYAHDQGVPEWQLVEEFRIGSVSGEGPGALASVGVIAVDDKSRLWVYDNFDSQIKVFDSDGRHVRTIGRSGAGPGEFRSVIGMTWDGLGQLWVVDAVNARYGVYDTSGSLIADYRRPIGIYDAHWTGGFDDHGRFFDQAYLTGSCGRLPQVLIEVSRGEPGDTITLPDYASQAACRGSMHFPPPYSRDLLLAFDPGGFVWYGVTDRYRITRRALADGSEFAFDGPARPRSLTRAERDSVDRYLETAKKEFNVSYNEGIKPDLYPIFDGLYLNGNREQIWVKRAEGNAHTQFDVFDRAGRLASHALSDLVIQARPSPVIIGSRLWALVLGEFDEHYIVRFRVVK
jgi:6-bladed beta-propeller